MRNNSKIERYIETRLWNSKIKGTTASSKTIMSELELRYRVNVNEPDIRNYLQKCISRIRSKANKRYSLLNQNIKNWLKTLGVQEDLVKKWWTAGIITNKKSAGKIAVILKDVYNG